MCMGVPGGAVVRNLPASLGDTCSIPGSGGFPGEGNGNPLQCSCLENPMDRGAWGATVQRVSRDMTEATQRTRTPEYKLEGLMPKLKLQ